MPASNSADMVAATSTSVSWQLTIPGVCLILAMAGVLLFGNWFAQPAIAPVLAGRLLLLGLAASPVVLMSSLWAAWHALRGMCGNVRVQLAILSVNVVAFGLACALTYIVIRIFQNGPINPG